MTQESPRQNSGRRPLIFLLGVMGRSGTNFLYHLLGLHPKCCGTRGPVWEDFVLAEAHRLDAYARAVRSRWSADWGGGDENEARLRQCLGTGLEAFLRPGDQERRWVLCKTPTTLGVGRIFDYFPEARLILLVRDGRAVVESGVRSFGWNREEATRTWARAAAEIKAFEQAHPARRDAFRIVRYEDLVTDRETQLRALFEWLGMDAEVYRYAKADEMSVRGSSELADREGGVHWQPVDQDEAFDPLKRWEGWSRRDHERFNWLAGEELREFGYGPVTERGGAIKWRLHNIILDVFDVRWRIQMIMRKWRRWREARRGSVS